MSTRKEHGFLRRNGLQIQPDRKIIGKNDGTLEGSIEWVVDRDNEHLLPQIYSAHPDDPRLLVYHQEIVRNMAGKSTLTCQYMGISSDPTPRIYSVSQCLWARSNRNSREFWRICWG